MRLTQRAQELVAEHLGPGMIAVDATAGNGHDTLFLAKSVGESGTVYAIDIQESSIIATAALLEKNGWRDQVRLVQASHEDWTEIVPLSLRGEVKVVMMNLGYLPGGNHTLVTKATSTLKALEEAWDWLSVGGILTVLAYIGHPGGEEECQAVRTKLMSLIGASGLLHEEPSRAGSNGPVLFWCLR